MNFFYQLYYSLLGFVSSPFRSADEGGGMAPHHRGLLLGAPAILVGMLIVATTVWAQLGSDEELIKKYEAKKSDIREQAGQVVALLKLNNILPEDQDLPIEIREKISEEFRQMNEQELLDKKDELLKEWELYLYKLIKLDPLEDEHKLELAECAHQQGPEKADLVRSLLRELAPRDAPGNKKAQLAMGVSYAQQKYFGLAAIHLQNALQSDPDYHQARNQLARVYIANGEYVRGLEELNKIFDQHLIDYPQMVKLAQVAYQKTNDEDGESRMLEKAIRVFREYVLNSGNSNVDNYWSYLILAYIARKDFEPCERLLSDIITRENEPRELLKQQNRLLELRILWAASLDPEAGEEVEQKRFDLVQQTFRSAPNDSRILRMLAQMAFSDESSFSEEALDLYDPLSDNDPPAGVLIEISNYYLQQMEAGKAAGDRDAEVANRKEAIRFLERAHLKEKRNEQTANNLAYLLIQQGNERINEALQLSRMATSSMARKRPVEEISEFFDTLGHVQIAKAMALKNSDQDQSDRLFFEAIASLNNARKGRPANVDIMNSLVYCYREVGDSASASLLEKEAARLESQQADDAGDDSANQ